MVELTDEDIISMRQRLRSGEASLRLLAAEYRTDRKRITNAIKGNTFQHLNEFEPPVEDIGVKKGPRKIFFPKTKAAIDKLYKLGYKKHQIKQILIENGTTMSKVTIDRALGTYKF
jgi:hypothetical protein